MADEAFKEADVVVEDRFYTPKQKAINGTQ